MNYIINPSVFYWISVAQGLGIVAVLSLVFGIVGLITLGAIYWVNDGLFDEEEERAYRIASRIIIPTFIFGLLGVVFIPDKQTLIEMLVAKTATVENAEWTLDAIKQAVDYIVAALK